LFFVTLLLFAVISFLESTLAKLLDQTKQRNQMVLQQGLAGIQITQQVCSFLKMSDDNRACEKEK
jgi:hypothetical protein